MDKEINKEIAKRIEDDFPGLRAIRQMEVGEVIVFSARRCGSVRAAISNVSFEEGRKYMQLRDHEQRLLYVERIS